MYSDADKLQAAILGTNLTVGKVDAAARGPMLAARQLPADAVGPIEKAITYVTRRFKTPVANITGFLINDLGPNRAASVNPVPVHQVKQAIAEAQASGMPNLYSHFDTNAPTFHDTKGMENYLTVELNTRVLNAHPDKWQELIDESLTHELQHVNDILQHKDGLAGFQKDYGVNKATQGYFENPLELKARTTGGTQQQVATVRRQGLPMSGQERVLAKEFAADQATDQIGEDRKLWAYLNKMTPYDVMKLLAMQKGSK